MVEREAFLMKPKQQCHLSKWVERVYAAQSWKERRLLCESIFILTDKRTMILKNIGKKSFLDETKVSMSFIPIRGMSLWCPIMKRKEIIMWIHICPNWEINFNTKKWWKKNVSDESMASMTFSSMRRISLWCLIVKGKEITIWIRICPNWEKISILKNGGNRSFCYETKALNFIYPNEQNKFMVSNHEKKKLIVMWFCLCPNWLTNFDSKKWWEEKLLMKLKHQCHLP